MRRREFIALVGAASAAPLTVRAQQPTMPVIRFLSSAAPQSYAHVVAAFRQGLKEVGYVEGQNITIESLWADGQYDRLPSLAKDLVDHPVVALFAGGGMLGAPQPFRRSARTESAP